MSFMDALTPTSIQPSGAMKVSLLTVEVPADQPKQWRPQIRIETLSEHLRKKQIRKLKDRVRDARKCLERAEKELEEALCVMG